MDISAESVRRLREETGAGMMDCKRALVEAQGDAQAAKEILRKKGLASAASRASRAATDGVVGSYIHHNAKTGVLVEVNCETDFVARTPEFQALVKDIALHIAAAAPRYLTREEVPPAVLDKEREIYRAQAAAQGKPPAVQEKIAEGKLTDFYATFCLLDQPFVRDAKLSVGQLIQEKVALIKENIVIRRFVRFQVGEPAASPAPSE